MVLTNGCGITRVRHWLAKPWGYWAERLRQRLREWCWEASARRGKKRRDVNVEECVEDLLAWIWIWIVEQWEGTKALALAMDARTWGERFTALSISMVIRGCVILVARHLTKANEPGAWKPHGIWLLSRRRVVVMTDRGLSATWLFEAIQEHGWHPANGKQSLPCGNVLLPNESMGRRGEGEQNVRPIGLRVHRRGCGWMGQGVWSETGM